MRFKLSDEDRERLGTDEWIDYNTEHLSTEDGIALESEGISWQAWGTTLVNGFRAAVWFSLRRAGRQVPFADVQFDIRQIVMGKPSPGKAPSPKSSAGTRSTSATRRAGTSSRKTSAS